MKVLLVPQISFDGKKIIYKFDNKKITATIGDIMDVFDFTGVPNGKLKLFDSETGKDLIQTNLPVNPVISAEKKDGILYLELLNWISEDASYSERIPEWFDAKDYAAPKNGHGPIKESQEPKQTKERQELDN